MPLGYFFFTLPALNFLSTYPAVRLFIFCTIILLRTHFAMHLPCGRLWHSRVSEKQDKASRVKLLRASKGEADFDCGGNYGSLKAPQIFFFSVRCCPPVPLSCFSLTLLCSYFSSHSCYALKFFFSHLPCCALVRFTIPLPAVALIIFFFALTLLCSHPLYDSTYPAVALKKIFFFWHLRVPCCSLKFFFFLH